LVDHVAKVTSDTVSAVNSTLLSYRNAPRGAKMDAVVDAWEMLCNMCKETKVPIDLAAFAAAMKVDLKTVESFEIE
jgi:hypothetical protein